MRKYIFLVFLFFIYKPSFSQHGKDSSVTIPALSATYSFQIPGGDLARRFGWNSSIGASFLMKFKSNWIVSAEGSYLFGNQLKSEASGVLDKLKTSNGELISNNGFYSVYLLTERGYNLNIKGGRLFNIDKKRPNSGIVFMMSGGVLGHKINIENDGSDTPQIIGEKRLGYDKLTSGFALGEFIGYMFFGKSEIANFYAGLDFYQAWTHSRRPYDYDTMKKDNKQRHDYLYSFKIGWVIPFYRRSTEKWYYY